MVGPYKDTDKRTDSANCDYFPKQSLACTVVDLIATKKRCYCQLKTCLCPKLYVSVYINQ